MALFIRMDLLFKISLPFATIGLLAFIYYTFTRKPGVFATATVTSAVTFLCLSIILVMMMGNFEMDNSLVQGSRYLVFAWLIMAIYFFTEFRYRIRLLGSILMPIALMLMLISTFVEKNTSRVLLRFGNITTVIHMALVFLGLALLFLSFAAALLFLVKRSALKNHRFSALDDMLPPLAKLNGLMEQAFSAGFPAFTVGLILGIVYAGSVFTEGWVWDSTIIWGLINWFIYSILFVLRQSGRLNNGFMARGIVLLFFFILASFMFTSHHLSVEKSGEQNTSGLFLDDK